MPKTAYLDLFSGIGGFALGAYWAGLRFDYHYFSEIDDYAIKVYQRRFPDAIGLGDIKKIKGENLPKADWIITGGFPCQDISVAGKGAGMAGKRSGLWFEYARIISELRPRYAIMENVGALSFRGLDAVLGSLAEIGYDAEWQDIRASDVGAPHRRERLWIIAYPNGKRRESRRDIEREHEHSFSQEWKPSEDIEQRDIWINRISAVCQTIPDSHSGRCQQCNQEKRSISELNENGESIPDPDSQRCKKQYDAIASGERHADSKAGGNNVSDTRSIRQAERRDSGLRASSQDAGIRADIRSRTTLDECREWWKAEPDVGRVVDGVPNRVDRLRCLGNSIVPQIAELIFSQEAQE